jgi:hypothetical protein
MTSPPVRGSWRSSRASSSSRGSATRTASPPPPLVPQGRRSASRASTHGPAAGCGRSDLYCHVVTDGNGPERGSSKGAGPRAFELDLVGGEPGWLRICGGEFVVDLPSWFLVPWRLAARQVAMIEWWSRTRAVFRARLGTHDYEPDRVDAVLLRAPYFRDPDLAIWLYEPTHLPAEHFGGLRSPVTVHRNRSLLDNVPPFHSGVAVAGVYLTIHEDRIDLKRALEWWGAVFPSGGEPS